MIPCIYRKSLLTFLLIFIGIKLWSQADKLLMFKTSIKNQGSLAYAYDQNFLFIGDGDRIQLFSTNAMTLSRELKIHSHGVLQVLPLEDNVHFVSVNQGGEIVYWDYLSGRELFTVQTKEKLNGATLLGGSRIAGITDDKLVLVDLTKKSIVYEKRISKKPLRCVTSTRNQNFIIAGGGDTKLFLCNAQDGNITASLAGHENYIRAIDISDDDALIASVGDDGLLIIHDFQGHVKINIKVAKNWLHSVKFSHDSKFVAVGDDRGTVYIYSVEKGLLEERISQASLPILSVQFSPNGKELSFLSSQSYVKTWNISRHSIASVFKMNDQKDRTPPQIYISNPPNIQDDKVRVYKDMVEIKGTLMDESGIRGLKVNGLDIPIKENNNFLIIQPLAMGDNLFTIEARDINDNIAVKRFSVQRKNLSGEEFDPVKAKNFLFIVGVNDYEFWPKLNNAVKDANDITNSLLSNYNFGIDNLIMIKNEQATRANIYKNLRSLIELITPQDNLVVYFSGHGYFDGVLNEGYWIPVDARLNNSGDYLSNSDILKIIGSIDSQHTFLIADACFSGSLFSESKRGYAENVEKYKSRWGLASGRLEVVSDGSIGQNSPFALATVTFLNDNEKDKFAISELIQFVKMKVSETSSQTPLGNPLKVLGDEGGEMVIYKRRK